MKLKRLKEASWTVRNRRCIFVTTYHLEQMRSFSRQQVAVHDKDESAWMIIDGDVLDVTHFNRVHPGGRQVLMEYAGKDASGVFWLYHNKEILRKYLPRLKIGVLDEQIKQNDQSLFPYGNPIWYTRFRSVYHKETHFVFRDRVRKFVDTILIPSISEWRNASEPPRDIYKAFGAEGFITVLTGARPWPSQYLPPEVDMNEPKDLDYFHEAILLDELARCGHAGCINALTNGAVVAVSPIFYFGSDELKQKYLTDLLIGNTFAALAITEPQTGSDVASLHTTAHVSSNEFIIRGNKKYITNGMYADVFVTAVRTGEGRNGISMVLVDKTASGLSMRKMKFRDSNPTGTAYLDFDDCRVPYSNLLGIENNGFQQIMWNFNHERLYYVCVALRLARICLEASLEYASRRKTFGKYLHEHQALRMKVALMIRRVESLQAWFEQVSYQMTWMSHEQANRDLGDIICMMKSESAKVYELCAREATQIFGGNALYSSGVGSSIENAVLQVKSYQIPAGAEDVLDDFGARTAFRRAKAHL